VNLPNAITIGRIFLVPLLVVVLLTKFEGRLILGVRKELVGAAIFGLASLTDWLDGYLARRRGLLEARGDVDRVTGDERLALAADDDLARVDPDARLEPVPGDRLLHLRRGAHRAERVVARRHAVLVVAVAEEHEHVPALAPANHLGGVDDRVVDRRAAAGMHGEQRVEETDLRAREPDGAVDPFAHA